MWSGVIIHHSGVPDTPGTDTLNYRRYHMQARGWQDIGYHVVIEQVDGEYLGIMGRRLNLAGSHCRGLNSTNLGVCFSGDFTQHKPSWEQLDMGARVVAGLCDSFGIPTDNITTHRDHDTTACPGEFPLDVFKGMVEEHRR